MTYVHLELWRVPCHKLHEVTCSLREEHLMVVVELWGKILTCEVVINVDEYSHSLRMEGFWHCEELDSHLERLEIQHKEFAVHEFDDRPECVRTCV